MGMWTMRTPSDGVVDCWTCFDSGKMESMRTCDRCDNWLCADCANQRAGDGLCQKCDEEDDA